MNKHVLRLAFVAVLISLTMLACEFSVSTANIKEAKMARDYEGSEPTTVFGQDETFYCVVELANAPDDITVRTAWTAVAVEGVEPNVFIDETELTSGSGMLHFQLSNDGLWPLGRYKVEIYLNGELDRTLDFVVQ